MESADYEVQLDGDRLAEARKIDDQISTSLTAMAEFIIAAMEGPSHREVDLSEVRFSYGTSSAPEAPVETHGQPAGGGVHTLVVHGPEYCYVYDGEAQVCRPCSPAEEAQ